MNSIVTNDFETLFGTLALRDDVFAVLEDADLAYRLPNNLPLRELLLEMGTIQQSYTGSFSTFQQVWDVPVDPSHGETLETLKAWFASLDESLKNVLSALSQEEVDTKMITRGFDVSIAAQVQIYIQALLIHYGKATLYLRALEKPLSEKLTLWIG